MLYFVKTVFDRLTPLFLSGLLLVCCERASWCNDVGVGTITADRLNVRSAPSTSASRINRLKRGTRVTVLDDTDGWLKISYQGQEGYIRNTEEFVQVGISRDDLSDLKEEAEKISQEIESHRTDLKKYSRQGHEILEGLNEIDLSLHGMQTKIDRLRVKITALDEEISAISEDIRALERRIEKNRKHASDRLVALYKLNLVGKMDVLGTADSVYEFLKIKKDVTYICEYDEAVLTSFLKDLGRQSTLIQNLDSEKKEKMALEKELTAQVRSMSAEKSERKKFLTNIRQKEALQKAALASLQQAARSLDQTIASLYTEPSRKMPDQPTGEFTARKGLLKMPVDGKIVTKFGKYRNRELNIDNFRSGIDISAEQGTPIRSVHQGQVIFASWFKGYGNMLILDHGDSYYTVYAHIQEMFKKEGDAVDTNEVIGTVGEAAASQGPTLYFEIRHEGNPVDPKPWLDRG